MTYKADGTDVTIDGYVTKSYLIDAYPSLVDISKTPGLWLWGRNASGALGDNSNTHRSSPVQTVSGGTNWKQVSCSVSNASAIKTDGTLWTWGSGSNGELGNNAASTQSSPVQTASAGTNWKQVSCGSAHMSAIKTDGSLWAWGINGNGQLGDNTTVKKSSPVQTVSGGTNWKQVSCGGSHTAAIKTDGSLWLWGQQQTVYGQLGDNTGIQKSSPVQTVSGGTNWKQVSCGNVHTAAIKTDGSLWLWGGNDSGQLGINTILAKSSPVQTVSGGTNWKQVSCTSSSNFTAAIKTDGSLWAWGINGNGQLGDNTTSSRSSPVQTVSGGTNWKQVSCGGSHTAAIKTDGSLWLWGSSTFYGQLGDNTTSSRSSPVQTVSAGTNWKQVSCGGDVSAAIKDFSEDF